MGLHHEVDDAKLYENEIVRIRDVFVKFYESRVSHSWILYSLMKYTCHLRRVYAQIHAGVMALYDVLSQRARHGT